MSLHQFLQTGEIIDTTQMMEEYEEDDGQASIATNEQITE